MTARLMLKALLTAAIAIVLSPGSVAAQGCCTPGSSPFGGVAGGPSGPGTVEVGTLVDLFELDQAYTGTLAVDDPAARFSRVVSTTFYARIGLHRRVVAVVQFPFDDRMREGDLVFPSSTRRYKFRNTALGDLSTLVMARIWPSKGMGPTVVNLGGGLKWPTGPDDATQEGLRLPIELQTGSGTYDAIVAFSAYRLSSWGSVTGVGTVRLPSRAASGYRWGKEANLALLAEWALGSWRIGPELRGRFAGANDFRDRQVKNTGGHRVAGGAHVAKDFFALGLTVEASWVTPLWQDLNGLQLGVSREILVGVRWAVR